MPPLTREVTRAQAMTPEIELNSKHDPKTLEVAKALHNDLKPTATILFGSRARGDHRSRESDIDLLVVSEELDMYGTDSRAHQERAEAAAEKLYGHPVKVQLVVMTKEQVDDTKQYVDSTAGVARWQGLVAGGDPQNFQSIYNLPEKPPPLHSFATYQAAMEHSLEMMHAMTILHTGEMPTQTTKPILITMERLAHSMEDGTHADQRPRMMTFRAKWGMECAVQAGVGTQGRIPHKQTGPKDMLTELLNGRPDLYRRDDADRLLEEQEASELSRDCLMETAVPRINELRENAKKIRKATGNAARKDRKEWLNAHPGFTGYQPSRP